MHMCMYVYVYTYIRKQWCRSIGHFDMILKRSATIASTGVSVCECMWVYVSERGVLLCINTKRIDAVVDDYDGTCMSLPVNTAIVI